MINDIRRSFTNGFLPIAWFVSLILVYVSWKLMKEDYYTSMEGYKLIPTQKAGGDEILTAVALIPQAGAVLVTYMLAQQFFVGTKARRFLLMLWGAFLLWDNTTDVYYKTFAFKDGVFSMLTVIAIGESLLLFTIGSEALFTLSIGFCLASFGGMLSTILAMFGTSWQQIKEGLEEMFPDVSSDFFSSDNSSGQGQNQHKQHKQHNQHKQ